MTILVPKMRVPVPRMRILVPKMTISVPKMTISVPKKPADLFQLANLTQPQNPPTTSLSHWSRGAAPLPSAPAPHAAAAGELLALRLEDGENQE